MERQTFYVDPATGKRYDCSNPTNQGWLTKQSAWLKDWRRRYFTLKVKFYISFFVTSNEFFLILVYTGVVLIFFKGRILGTSWDD